MSIKLPVENKYSREWGDITEDSMVVHLLWRHFLQVFTLRRSYIIHFVIFFSSVVNLSCEVLWTVFLFFLTSFGLWILVTDVQFQKSEWVLIRFEFWKLHYGFIVYWIFIIKDQSSDPHVMINLSSIMKLNNIMLIDEYIIYEEWEKYGRLFLYLFLIIVTYATYISRSCNSFT